MAQFKVLTLFLRRVFLIHLNCQFPANKHSPSSENWRGKHDSTLALDVLQTPFGRGAYVTAEAVPVAVHLR